MGKMEPNENRRTISTCNKNRNSSWPDGSPKNTTRGMKMVVTITKGEDGRRKSTTTYEAP